MKDANLAHVAERVDGTAAASASGVRRLKGKHLLGIAGLDATEITPPNMQPPGGPFYVGGGNVLSTIPNVGGVE